MSDFNYKQALIELEALRECAPPPREPQTIREFVLLHADQINALVARGWPAQAALQRLAKAGGIDVNERTLLSYLRAAKPRAKRGRPSKKDANQ